MCLLIATCCMLYMAWGGQGGNEQSSVLLQQAPCVLQCHWRSRCYQQVRQHPTSPTYISYVTPHPTRLSVHLYPFTGPLTLLARCELTSVCTRLHRVRSAPYGIMPEAHHTAPRQKRTRLHRARSAQDGTAPEAHKTAPRSKIYGLKTWLTQCKRKETSTERNSI